HTVPRAPAGLPVVVVPDPGADGAETRAALTVLRALSPPLREQLQTMTVAGPVRKIGRASCRERVRRAGGGAGPHGRGGAELGAGSCFFFKQKTAYEVFT